MNRSNYREQYVKLQRKHWNSYNWGTQTQKCAFNKNLALQSLGFSLPTLCWLLGERKWKCARFSPPENNTNPAKRKSNIQSTSQETILKPKTSQWEINLSAAGTRCSAHHYASLFQSFNRKITQTIPHQRSKDSTPFSLCLSLTLTHFLFVHSLLLSHP